MLQCRPIDGITEVLPAYCSIMIHYRPERILYADLVQACLKLLEDIDTDSSERSGNEALCEIPVLYGGEFGVDLDKVADYHKKSIQEIVDIHTSHDNFIYMIGFSPGMGYLGSDNGLSMPRRSSPRLKVEGGAIIIWENQSIIFPLTAPTGWNVIGRTPVRIFDLRRANPFLLEAGMWVRFRQVGQKEYDSIQERVDAGAYECSFGNKESL